jgi:hypothetical protein
MSVGRLKIKGRMLLYSVGWSKAKQEKQKPGAKDSGNDRGCFHSETALDYVWGLQEATWAAERECPEKVGRR